MGEVEEGEERKRERATGRDGKRLTVMWRRGR